MSLDVLTPRLPVKVLLLGDSITRNIGAWLRTAAASFPHATERTPVLWGSYLNGADLHSGVSGNTMVQMLARVTADVTAWRPEVVFVHGGTNDIVLSDGATCATRLATLIAAIRAENPAAYIIASVIPPSSGYTANRADYVALMPSVVEAAGPRVTLIDPDLQASDISGDNIHPITGTVGPPATGYALLGQQYWLLGLKPYLDLARVPL